MSRLRSQPWPIFWVALAVRLAYMTLARTWRVRPLGDHFQFAWEMGRIARALATGYGYADPFAGHTGPTAWLAPAYPLLIAGVFKLAGVYTPLSAWILLAINCVLSASTALCVYAIARRCFGARTALWSAWVWALYPAAMQYAVKWIWEMTLTTFLFSAALALALAMRGIGEAETPRQTARQWALFGLLWGLIALSNPSLLLFLPVLGLWTLIGGRVFPWRTWLPRLPAAALALVVFLAVVAPWSYRNTRVLHAWVPLRSNFGAELYASTQPYANGFHWGTTVPNNPYAPELKEYAAKGEIRFVAERSALAHQWIRTHRRRFWTLAADRFFYYWAGVVHPSDEAAYLEFGRSLNFQLTSLFGLLGLALAWRRGVPGAGLFAAAFLLLPLTYYFVSVQARFRHPLEPLIAILSVYLFQSAEKSWRVRWISRQPEGPSAAGDLVSGRAAEGSTERRRPSVLSRLGVVAGPGAGQRARPRDLHLEPVVLVRLQSR